jgi:hypothetical protein
VRRNQRIEGRDIVLRRVADDIAGARDRLSVHDEDPVFALDLSKFLDHQARASVDE